MAPNTDIATRAFVVSLKAPCGGKTTAEVAEITGLSTRQVNRIYARAIERGFDPNHRPIVIRDEWLCDASRSGRPSKQESPIREEVVAKLNGAQYIGYYRLADSSPSWLPEDKANEEAWSNEEDEGGTP